VIRHLGPGADVEALVAAALEQGREVHVVRAAATKESTLAAFADTLDFPAWYGANLDALADCLGHLARRTDPEDRPAWQLVVDGVAGLGREDPRALAGLCDVLRDIAASHPRFHVTVVDR